MQITKILILLSFFLPQIASCSSPEYPVTLQVIEDCSYISVNGKRLYIETGVAGRPSPLWQLFRAKQNKNKKLTAAALAFPFPFGIVGLHRIYLGCAPYVPVVYIASLGGAFGILPFIDCCVLIFAKDTQQFTDGKKVFMWID
jgi:TM2 domain-containing membrane protein YozV